MSDDKKKVVSILRSLIISSPRSGKPLRELVRDFCEFEGKKIPIFEYRSVEEFLRSTGEFIFENLRGELIIFEKPNEKSNHIAELVAEQNKPKKRSQISSGFRHPMRKPLRGFILPHQRTPSAYPIRSPQKTIFPKRNVSDRNVSQCVSVQQRRPVPTTTFTFENLKVQVSHLKNDEPNRTISSSKTISDGSTHQNQPIQQNDLRNQINQIRENNTMESIDLTADSADESKSNVPSKINNGSVKRTPPNSPKKLETIASTQHRQDSKPPQPEQPEANKTTTSIRSPLSTKNPFIDNDVVPTPDPIVRFTRMQDRSKNLAKFNCHSIVNKDVGVAKYDRKSVNTRLEIARHSVIEKTKGNCDLPTANAIQTPAVQSPARSYPKTHETRLFDYCKENGHSIPTFKIFKIDGRYQCHVTIDNIRYSSYPTDYRGEGEARIETAKHAMDRLTAIREQQMYEMCLDCEAELAKKIYDCIKDYSTGVFSKKIPEYFMSIYGQLLPSDWLTTLAKHPECFTVEECINDSIVYVVDAAEPNFYQKMDKLQLPWNDEYWGLLITSTVSTAEIWGRLVGEEYSKALDSLVTEIELELLKNKQVTTDFNVGQIYLVIVSENAYRVRVEKVDRTRQQCLCFGVDEGDLRWYNMSEIFICHNKFLKLAPQAIRFALHDMDDFDEINIAQKHLEKTLLNGLPLVGEIFTKKDDFMVQEESSDLLPVIQVLLYDTTTAEDINLNQLIADKICADIPAPKLINSELTQVHVSHISDTGDIFIQMKENGLHYINKLIHKLTQLNEQSQKLAAGSNSRNDLFLVYDDEALKWCRGKLINKRPVIQSYEMLLIDYGKTSIVPLSKIMRFETYSQALLTYPSQAFQVKLNGMTEIPSRLISTMRGYFNGDSSGYVIRMESQSLIPEVKLYYSGNGCMINVKEGLEDELQRESSSTRGSISSYSRQSSISSIR